MGWCLKKFRADKDILINAMKSGFAWEALYSAHPRFRNDAGVMALGISYDKTCLQLASVKLRRVRKLKVKHLGEIASRSRWGFWQGCLRVRPAQKCF